MDHHVYFWLKDEYRNPESRAGFERGLSELYEIERVVGGRWSVPADVPSRPVCDQSWDYALTMRFGSIEDHNFYQVHTDHGRFVEAFKDWWAKVLVMDLA